MNGFYRGPRAELKRKALREAAIAAVNATRTIDRREDPITEDWQLQTSNSFRRIGARGDGDVLCGTTHPLDRQPDLHARPGVLEYIVAAQPVIVLDLLATIERIEREVWDLRDQLPTTETAGKIAATLQTDRIDRDIDPYRTPPARTFHVDVNFLERLLVVLAGVGAMATGTETASGWDRHRALVAEVRSMLEPETKIP